MAQDPHESGRAGDGRPQPTTPDVVGTGGRTTLTGRDADREQGGVDERQRAVAGPFTVRDLTVLGSIVVLLIGSLIPLIVLSDGSFGNMWNYGLGLHHVIFGLLLPLVVGGLFVARRLSGNDEVIRIGSLSLDQFASVVASVAAVFSFLSVVSFFQAGPIIALIGALGMLVATVGGPHIPVFAGDFAVRPSVEARLVARPAVPAVRVPKAPKPATTAAGSSHAGAPAVPAAANPGTAGTVIGAGTTTGSATPTPAAASGTPATAAAAPVTGAPGVGGRAASGTDPRPGPDAEGAERVSGETGAPGETGALGETDAAAADVLEPATTGAARTDLDDDTVARPVPGTDTGSGPGIDVDDADTAIRPRAGHPEEAVMVDDADTVVRPSGRDADANPDDQSGATAVAAPIGAVVDPYQDDEQDRDQDLHEHRIDAAGDRFAAGAGEGDRERGRTERRPDEYEAFWFAVAYPRPAFDERTGAQQFLLEPGAWILALQDRGTSFVVQHTDGRVGVLHDLNSIERA
ncbi:hypothetical protein GCM10011512_04620 [Tersicoccus solisilvae]|uniref:Uncharacterized protein n=1 Tax=Tersicoccus solisilvae TaxID=1882339 RepID=A0ABQ1NNE8_9MICC|nr:hypothetical protein [Tersicoccus solisilvae]GGC80927.1 hypothetical protein GCM10011512_04620 [Tersicoccus solisilvae]